MDLRTCKRSRNCITAEKEREREDEHTQHYSHAAKKQKLNGGGKQRAKKTKVHSDGWVLDLPLDLIYDILSRLPTNSVFSCKCVCKTFLNIIVDPYFGKIARCIDHRIIIADKNTLKFYLAPMFDFERATSSSSASSSSSDNDQNYGQALTVPNSLSLSEDEGLASLVGSCNGLLCIRFMIIDSFIYCVCNPLLGEFMVLPDSNPIDCAFVGFGFCLKTKQYKVIRFLKCLSWEILTLGTNCWRRIAAPLPPRDSKAFNSAFNGDLHWVTNSMVMSNIICSFNLETEHFEYIPPPTNVHPNFMSACLIELGELDGLFSVRYMVGKAQFEVFVMKEYGVKESWTKEISVNLWPHFGGSRCLRLIRYLNNGVGLLGCYSDGCLNYYNSRTGTTEVIMRDGSYCDAIDHDPSFVSLKDVAGPENVEVVPPKRLRSFWSVEGIKLLKTESTAKAEVIAGGMGGAMAAGEEGMAACAGGVAGHPRPFPRHQKLWTDAEKLRLALLVATHRRRFPRARTNYELISKRMPGRSSGALVSAWAKYGKDGRQLAGYATAEEIAVAEAAFEEALAEVAAAEA